MTLRFTLLALLLLMPCTFAGAASPYFTFEDGASAIVNGIESTMMANVQYLCDTSVRYTSVHLTDCLTTEAAARWTATFPFRLQAFKVSQFSASACNVEGAIFKNGVLQSGWACTSVSRAYCITTNSGTPLSFAVGDQLSIRRTPSGCSGDRDTMFLLFYTRGP